MLRTSRALVAGLLLVAFSTGYAADEAPARNFKLTFTAGGQPRTFWLLHLDSKDGKWTGKVVSTPANIPDSTLGPITVTGDRLRFTIKVNEQELPYEGKVPGDADKKALGSFTLEGQVYPAELERTRVASLDPFDLNKEILARPNVGPELFEAVNGLLGEATDKKATLADVRGWAARASKAAEAYGPRYQREVSLHITEALAGQPTFAPVAVEYARQTARLLNPDEEMGVQLRIIPPLVQVLRQNGKADEARELQAQVDKLVAKDYQEYIKKLVQFQPDKFGGRKAANDRAVLVELFTGAQCPPCIAADLAFDVLGKTYKPADVVLLQYHLHIPGADPLTNPDTEGRHRFYEDEIEGTPTILFNGKAGASGGGSADAAQEKYKEYRKVIDPLLEKPTSIKLKANAVRKGDKLEITAQASGVDKPGEKLRLRLALVEEQVRYTGGNGLRYHHHVVRALPGGAEGMALKEKTGKQTATVDLQELREKWNRYLNAAAKRLRFTNSSRPMEFRKLAVVAFVQDDATKEVLQAVQVPVTEEK
jgi:hypothetical protein